MGDDGVTAQSTALSPIASRCREEKTVAQLAEEEFVARKHYEHLGASNVAGLSYEEQKKSAIAYAEAQARAFAARAALDAAIRDPSRMKLNEPRGSSAAEAPTSAEGVNNTIAQ